MSEKLKDILSNINPEVDQQTLLLYLQGKLDAGKQHDVEKALLDSDFDADALEGLQNIKNEQHLALLLDALNRDIKKKTSKRKSRRQKLSLRADTGLLLVLIIILLLVVISYFIIYRYLGQ